MRQLYELSVAPRKIWKPLPGGGPISRVLAENYFESIADFIATITTVDLTDQELDSKTA